MELFTRNHEPSWDRIVHICVHDDNKISEHINENSLYKILVLNEGTITISEQETQRIVSAPSLILLSSSGIVANSSSNADITVVYFRPTEIRDEFTIEKIDSGEFENYIGRTIYQDYLLVNSFGCKILPLSLSSHSKLQKTIRSMNNELTQQYDDFWPCRSRSYLMELLYYISYACSSYSNNVADTTVSENTIGDVIQYLNEHIADKITLDDITRKFSFNRNKLNELFLKETSMTCLNYLTKMRINLAKVILAETELQIAEISYRVGIADPNYFIKVFKKHTGVTPSTYRNSYK